MTTNTLDSRRPWYLDVWALGTTFFLAFAACLVLYMLQPASPKPATAPAVEFSAERALVYDRGVASVPHPAGSNANIRTQQYIVDTMNALGVPTQHVASPYVGGRSAGMRNMVLARLPGVANTKAVMLEAHYDSVPYGPGAADDCAGVSAMIEIAHALKAGPPLKNDVIFVFSDAEECGMLGARAFVEHPWVGDVGVVIGFESRGNQGKACMFETGTENGWLIEQLAKSGVHTSTSSCMADIYYRLPFRADFGIFKEAGLKGYNIAFVDNFAQYHTKNDDPAHLSLASLQDLGEYGLGLTQRLGNQPLERVTAPDVTYFTVAGPHMAYYPATWNRPLMVITIAVFIMMLLLGLVRGHVTFPGMIVGCLLFTIATAIVSGVQAGMLALLYGPAKLYALVSKDITQLPDVHVLQQNNLYGAAFALLGIALFILIAGSLVRFVRPQHLTVGGLAAWLATMFMFDAYLKGGVYMAQWPLLFGSIGLGLLFLTRDPDDLPPTWVALGSLFVIPGIVLAAPTYPAILSFIFVIASPASILIPVLILGLAIPQIALVTRRSRLWLPVLCTAIACFLLAAGLLNNGYNADHPKFDCVAYNLNLDANVAYWSSSDPAPDEWTSQFFPQGAGAGADPGSREPAMKAPAPVVASLSPEVRVVSDSIRDGARDVVVRIDSNHAESMSIQSNDGARVLSASVFGKPLDAADAHWSLNIHLFPREGIELSLRIESGKPLMLNLNQFSHGIPDIPGIKPRPDYIASEPNTIKRHKSIRDGEIHVNKTFAFPPAAAQ